MQFAHSDIDEYGDQYSNRYGDIYTDRSQHAERIRIRNDHLWKCGRTAEIHQHGDSFGIGFTEREHFDERVGCIYADRIWAWCVHGFGS